MKHSKKMTSLLVEMREFDSTGLSPDSIHCRLLSWGMQIQANGDELYQKGFNDGYEKLDNFIKGCMA